MPRHEKFREPPETDLDYYARPENYRGSNLDNLTRFLAARGQKESTEKKVVYQKKKKNTERVALFERYRHILPPETHDLFTSSSSEDEQETTATTNNTESDQRQSTTWLTPGGSNRTVSPDFTSAVSKLNPARFSAPLSRRPALHARFMSARGRLNSLPTEVNAIQYLHKFRRLSWAVVNVLKLAKAIIKRTDSPSALLKTFTAMSQKPEEEDQSENMKNYGLQFDPSYFRANREISISSEVKSILRLPPSHRSTEQIQTAMFGLQSLHSFAEYPLHMQEKLAKVAWYEIVTPMRTIIRQGHYAENFYFILAGQAVVTIGKQTAAILRKGTSFGELALLHHSKRTATVTSHDTVQLLSVGREDFFDIFMSGHGKDTVPDHIKFISNLDFMKDWPLERLLERPDQCLLHFFK